MKMRVSLQPTEPAEVALRKILRQLLEDLRENIEGILDDNNPESLHDLRVAVRRTRSALAQINGVLPPIAVAGFRSEFKWLGAMTGPLRDLDVLWSDMAVPSRSQPDHFVDLDPLLPLVESARQEAFEKVTAALTSPRFDTLLGNWSTFLDQETPIGGKPRNAATPILELASKRILKAHTKVLRRGKEAGEEPSTQALHRLRIDTKKLRYLLEFFRSLYPEVHIAQLVKELKRFQDILGAVNDTAVQQEILTLFAGDLVVQGPSSLEARAAVDRLAVILADRQREYVQVFAHRFASFAAETSRARCQTLFASSG